MAVTFEGASSGSILVPTSAGFTAHVPAATAVDDLMLLFVNLHDGSITGLSAPAGWSQIPGAFEPDSEIAVWTKRADASDAGGVATHHFGFTGGGSDAPVWTNTVWRDAPDYTNAVVVHDVHTTSHTVPDVDLPSSDTEDIVFATIDNVTGFSADALAIAGFTQRVYFQGAAGAVLAVFSKRAGAPGAQGAATITTVHNLSMGFIRLGVSPRELVRGVVTLPYFIPLGNTPAP